MATQKFKVGDMVQRINSANYNRGNYIHVGDVGKVVKVSANGHWIDVEVDGKVIPDNEDCNLKLISKPDDKIVITHDGKTTVATLYKNNRQVESAEANCSPEDTFDFNVGAKLALERLERKVKYGEYTIVKVKYPHGRQEYCFKTKDKTAKVGMEIEVTRSYNGRKCAVKVIEVIPSEKYTGEYPIDDMKEIKIVEVPKYWTGRVVCIECPPLEGFTVGKIYKVDDGKIIDNEGDKRPMSPDRITNEASLKNGYFKTWGNKFIPLVE